MITSDDIIHVYIHPYGSKKLYHGITKYGKKITRYCKEHGFDSHLCRVMTFINPVEIEDIDDNFKYNENDTRP